MGFFVWLGFFVPVSLPSEMILFGYWFCRPWLLCRCQWALSQTALLNQWAFCPTSIVSNQPENQQRGSENWFSCEISAYISHVSFPESCSCPPYLWNSSSQCGCKTCKASLVGDLSACRQTSCSRQILPACKRSLICFKKQYPFPSKGLTCPICDVLSLACNLLKQ